MTTPNIEELRLLAQTLEFSDAVRCSIQRAADLLQVQQELLSSQAERIAELEAENKLLSCIQENTEEENRKIRAQLASIAATEPVAWLYTAHDGSVQAFTNEPPQRLKELCKPVFNRAISPVRREPMSDGELIDAVANSIAEATRPMPAQDVTGLVDALKDVAQTLAWMQHGKCRGFSDGLLTTDEALDKARTALSKYKGAKL